MENTKVCSACKTIKSTELFFSNKSRKDGLHHSCKDCEKVRNKIKYDKNKTTTTQQIPQVTKQCSHCQIYKELHDFRKEKRNRDGHSNKCKVCKKAKLVATPAEKSDADSNFFDELETKWL